MLLQKWSTAATKWQGALMTLILETVTHVVTMTQVVITVYSGSRVLQLTYRPLQPQGGEHRIIDGVSLIVLAASAQGFSNEYICVGG